MLPEEKEETSFVNGAGGGSRTHTRGEPNWILNPARLPVSPLRLSLKWWEIITRQGVYFMILVGLLLWSRCRGLKSRSHGSVMLPKIQRACCPTRVFEAFSVISLPVSHAKRV